MKRSPYHKFDSLIFPKFSNDFKGEIEILFLEKQSTQNCLIEKTVILKVEKKKKWLLKMILIMYLSQPI